MAEHGIRTIDNISSNDLYNKYLGWIDEYNTNPEYVAEFIRIVGVKIDKPNAVLSEAHLEFVESADLNMPDWQKAKETSLPIELRYYALGQAFTRRFINTRVHADTGSVNQNIRFIQHRCQVSLVQLQSFNFHVEGLGDSVG